MKKLLYLIFFVSIGLQSQSLEIFERLRLQQSGGEVTPPQAIKAFPSAEGYGKNATGGRGHSVVKVTNLNDSGAGSLRQATSVSNRTVVFEVAGYIDLLSPLEIWNNITIAGQTAFRNGGQGITLRKSAVSPWDGPLVDAGSNLIIRYIRIRPGQRIEGSSAGDAFLCVDQSNIIFDHVSASYGSDELIDMTDSTNITFQNCLFTEPLSEVTPAEGGKLLMLTGTDFVSIYRTFQSESGQRNPLFSPKAVNSATPAKYEFINNYSSNLGFFGLGTQAYVGNSTPFALNIMNNYWQANESALNQSRRWVLFEENTGSKYYVNDENFDSRYRPTKTGTAWNLITTYSTDYGSNFTTPANTLYQTLTPHATQIVNDGVTLIPGLSVWSTLKNDFGCNLYRDATDLRAISQAENNNGPGNSPSKLDENDFGTAYSSLANMSSVPVDSNNDGIPDTWATANMGGASYNDIAPSGYTWLEEYLNGI